MPIFINKSKEMNLIKTIVYPHKTNKLDRGTFLYIPTYDRLQLFDIMTRLSKKSNFKVKVPRTMYMPKSIVGFKLGIKTITYRNNNVMKDIKFWKENGYINSVYMDSAIKDYNGLIDMTDYFNFAIPKTKFTKFTSLSLWQIMLSYSSPKHESKFLVWTPDNMSKNYVTVGSITVNDWKSPDLYTNFLYHMKYKRDELFSILNEKNIKILWTDYKYTIYIDPMEEHYSEEKPMVSLGKLMQLLRKMRLGKEIAIEKEDVEDKESEVALDISNPIIEEETADDIIENNIIETVTEAISKNNDEETTAEILDLLGNLSSSDASYEKKANDILNIIERTKKKNDYVPKRMAVIKKHETVKEKALVESLAKIDTDTKYNIEAKKVKNDNTSFNTFRIRDMEKQYVEKQAKIDRVNCLSHLANADVPVYLTSYSEELDSKNTDNLVNNIRVSLQSPDNADMKHTFSFQVPVLKEDKFLFLGNSDKVMSKQKIPLPIVRLQDRVVITTYYSKVFVDKNSSNISKVLNKVKKFVKALRNKHSNLTDFSFIPAIGKAQTNNLYSEELLELSRFWTNLTIDDNNYFTLDGETPLIGKLFGKEIFAVMGDDYLYDSDNDVKYNILSFLDGLMQQLKNKDILDLWNASVKGKNNSGTSSTTISVSGNKIPTILVVLHALDWNLLELLKRLKQEYDLEYEIIPDGKASSKTIDYDIEDALIFDGFILRLKYNSVSNRALLSPLVKYDFSNLNSLIVESTLEDEVSSNDLLNMANLKNFLIDPITKDVMDRIGTPSDYVGAIIYANALMYNYDRPISEISLAHERMPSNNELIQGMIYKVMTTEYASYIKKIKKGVNPSKVKFSIAPDSIIKTLQEATSISESSKLNPVSHVSNQLVISNKGIDGLGVNNDRAYKASKRLWDDSFYGIMSDVSPYNKNTGVNKQLVVNPGITDIRGFFNEIPTDLEQLESSEKMSVSEALGTFTQRHDSTPRLAMAMSQFNHLIPTKGSEPSLVTYGFDETLHALDSDFVVKAKGPGKILKMNNKFIKVQYDDANLGTEVYSVDAIVRNSEKAYYIPNKMKINDKLKEGKIINEDDVLAYNYMVYEEFDDNIPIFKSGPIVNVAIGHTQNSYEDSVVVSESLAKKLTTTIIKQITVKLSPTDIIKHFAKIDDKNMTNAGDILLQHIKTDGTNLNNVFGDSDDYSEILSKKTINHYQGYLRDMYVYTKLTAKGKLHLHPSINALINYVKTYYKKKENTDNFRTGMTLLDNNTVEHVVDFPASTPKNKVNAQTLYADQIMIEFFIEVEQPFSSGDKMTFGNTALKGVCSLVRADEDRAVGVVTGKKIDAIISPISPLARMVYSFFLNGILSECMVKMNEDIENMIKNEK